MHIPWHIVYNNWGLELYIIYHIVLLVIIYYTYKHSI